MESLNDFELALLIIGDLELSRRKQALQLNSLIQDEHSDPRHGELQDSQPEQEPQEG